MKPLTQREREIAGVAASFLLKGNPATRIAQHCHELMLTKENVRQFAIKLRDNYEIDPELCQGIQVEFHKISMGVKDQAQYQGIILKVRLTAPEWNEKNEIYKS